VANEDRFSANEARFFFLEAFPLFTTRDVFVPAGRQNILTTHLASADDSFVIICSRRPAALTQPIRTMSGAVNKLDVDLSTIKQLTRP
jgi:hypothetical protein